MFKNMDAVCLRKPCVKDGRENFSHLVPTLRVVSSFLAALLLRTFIHQMVTEKNLLFSRTLLHPFDDRDFTHKVLGPDLDVTGRSSSSFLLPSRKPKRLLLSITATAILLNKDLLSTTSSGRTQPYLHKLPFCGFHDAPKCSRYRRGSFDCYPEHRYA